MKGRSLATVRLLLLVTFAALTAGFAVGQYGEVYRLVTVLCLSCMGVD